MQYAMRTHRSAATPIVVCKAPGMRLRIGRFCAKLDTYFLTSSLRLTVTFEDQSDLFERDEAIPLKTQAHSLQFANGAC
jgi:hypothetical protein